MSTKDKPECKPSGDDRRTDARGDPYVGFAAKRGHDKFHLLRPDGTSGCGYVFRHDVAETGRDEGSPRWGKRDPDDRPAWYKFETRDQAAEEFELCTYCSKALEEPQPETYHMILADIKREIDGRLNADALNKAELRTIRARLQDGDPDG